jgi:hypothetical protein
MQHKTAIAPTQPAGPSAVAMSFHPLRRFAPNVGIKTRRRFGIRSIGEHSS